MNGTVNLEREIIALLKRKGPLSVAFITRFLNEMGIECAHQRVERVLRNLVSKGAVEAFYNGGRYNKRKHYRVR
jgi:predicted transcriptional regulator